jgi:FkbM family methyltransferase
MSLRKRLKRFLYGYCPGFAGAFPYFGAKVYFPPRSASFLAACQQGIFEAPNVRIIQRLVRPGTTYFDVGSNIGLMALPILHALPDCRVVSFEPSPNALPWLRRTIAGSSYSDRWSLVPKAVGARSGIGAFSVSAPELGMYDGLQATHRVSEMQRVEVQITTLDIEWEQLGSPEVSLVKIDIEGGELAALRGASNCIRECRPSFLIEWNELNLRAYQYQAAELISFAKEGAYRVYALPELATVTDEVDLRLHMLSTESYLLAPATY